MTTVQTDAPVIVLFDGVCNLCNGAVQFIIRRDPEARIRFASLQSEAGIEIMKAFALDPDVLHSILVIENGKLLQKSDAALRIAAHLHGFWSAMTVFRFIPRFLRDAVYDLVARSRYAVFGKRDQCMIPTPDLKKRFL